MCILHVGMCACVPVSVEVRGVRSLGAAVADSCDLPDRNAEIEPGSSGIEAMLLTTEAFHSP